MIKGALAAEQLEPLWTAADVAAYLRCSVSSVRQRSRAGDIPTLRVGGLVRFDPAVIRAWVRNPRPTATVLTLSARHT